MELKKNKKKKLGLGLKIGVKKKKLKKKLGLGLKIRVKKNFSVQNCHSCKSVSVQNCLLVQKCLLVHKCLRANLTPPCKFDSRANMSSRNFVHSCKFVFVQFCPLVQIWHRPPIFSLCFVILYYTSNIISFVNIFHKIEFSIIN